MHKKPFGGHKVSPPPGYLGLTSSSHGAFFHLAHHTSINIDLTAESIHTGSEVIGYWRHLTLPMTVFCPGYFNPIRPGGGGGEYPYWFQPSRTSLLFKQYLQIFATFNIIFWRTRVQFVAMEIRISTPCLVKFRSF